MSLRRLLTSMCLLLAGCATGAAPPAPQAVIAQPAQVAGVDQDAVVMPPVVIEKPAAALPAPARVDPAWQPLPDTTRPAKPTPATGATPEKVAAPDNTAVIRYVLAQSRAGYSGNCACPDDRDRAGRRCGARSAYSKAGGYAPLCYPRDVTQAMIEKARREMRL